MKSTPASSSVDPAADPAVVFDVRPLPGREKHTRIFQRWFDLPVGAFFVLLNDHDPVPLYYQFEAQFSGAFDWRYLQEGPEEFRVQITKLAAVCAPAPRPPGALPLAPAEEIDVRGLEPPEPLVRILAAMEKLGAGQTLRARTDREPCHLLREAEQRGFQQECQAQPDASWITTLTRR
jgi:uncharacterized protein (DUF2249 family)